jgi:hypothetical protein
MKTPINIEIYDEGSFVLFEEPNGDVRVVISKFAKKDHSHKTLVEIKIPQNRRDLIAEFFKTTK